MVGSRSRWHPAGSFRRCLVLSPENPRKEKACPFQAKETLTPRKVQEAQKTRVQGDEGTAKEVAPTFLFPHPIVPTGEGVGDSRGAPEEVPPTAPGPRCRKAPPEREGNGAETTRPPGDVDDAREGAGDGSRANPQTIPEDAVKRPSRGVQGRGRGDEFPVRAPW